VCANSVCQAGQDCHGPDHVIDGFTTTYAISTYHH
jgi:hypothetical protein